MSEQKPTRPEPSGNKLLGLILMLAFVSLIGVPAIHATVSLLAAGSPVGFVAVSALAGVVIWQLRRARSSRGQAAPPKDQKQQTVSPVAVVLACLLFEVCVIFFQLFRAEQGPSADWIVLAGIALPALLLRWWLLTERTLVGRMQQQPLSDHSAVAMSPELVVQLPEDHPMGPAPLFAVNTLSVGNLPRPSAAAARLIQRAHKQFDESVQILRRGAWFLLAGHIALVLLCGFLSNPDFSRFPAIIPIYCFSLFFWQGIFGPVFRIGYKGKSQTVRTARDWRRMNIWRAIPLALLILMVMVQPMPDAVPPLLATVAAVILTGYTIWIARALLKLRREALAHPPLKLLFLWVFGSRIIQNSLHHNLGVLWQHLGSVQLLKGAGYMIGLGEMVATLQGRADERVEETPEEVAVRLQSFRWTPDLMGQYGLNTILCADTVWQLALHTLLADTDVVVVNLASFSPKNRGIAYELSQLIDRLSPRRFLLLVDETTDLKFLIDMLRDAWEAMAAASPNRQLDTAPVQLFRVEHLNKPQRPRAGSDPGTDDAALQGEIEGIFQILCEGAVQARALGSAD